MRTFGTIAATAAAVLAAATVTACGSSSSPRPCTADDVKVTGGFGQAPTITLPDGCTPPSTLVVKDLVTGSGPTAKDGDQLTMNYDLVTWSNKQQADSSFGSQPFPLQLGNGGVIPGWDQGLVGIKQGGRRLLVIPPSLGYGAQGAGKIGPNETLVFVTDAVSVQPGS
jgi:peptidylprolyl isomerase